MATKSGQPINFQGANPLTLNMLLPAVKMIFWQNEGQPINFQNGQNVDNPVPLRHICVCVCVSYPPFCSSTLLAPFCSFANSSSLSCAPFFVSLSLCICYSCLRHVCENIILLSCRHRGPVSSLLVILLMFSLLFCVFLAFLLLLLLLPLFLAIFLLSSNPYFYSGFKGSGRRGRIFENAHFKGARETGPFLDPLREGRWQKEVEINLKMHYGLKGHTPKMQNFQQQQQHMSWKNRPPKRPEHWPKETKKKCFEALFYRTKWPWPAF